jgi:tetratricopeptide (TPR) repeat protein
VRHDQVYPRVAALLPGDIQLRTLRAQFLLFRGDSDRAIGEYEPVIERWGVNHDMIYYERLLLATGRDEEYRKLCQGLVAKNRPTDDSRDYTLALICAEGPQSGVPPASMVRWAEGAVAESGGTNRYQLFSLGVACYRAGQYERAVECLEKYGSRGPYAFFLAMAFHRLGQHEKSRQAYNSALESMRSVAPPPHAAAPRLAGHWPDPTVPYEPERFYLLTGEPLTGGQLLTYSAFLREAKAVLGAGEEPAPRTKKSDP